LHDFADDPRITPETARPIVVADDGYQPIRPTPTRRHVIRRSERASSTALIPSSEK
jgi:hypothetical protein